MALRCFKVSKAVAQNCRWRISLSRGKTSYSISSRSIVFKWALNDRVGHNVAEFGQIAFAGFNGVQRVGAPLLGFGVSRRNS